MGTTGNEFEQPGVNYPDREDSTGAESTPAADEPQRDGGGGLPGYAEPQPHGDGPKDEEPSHQAEGIGVIDAADPSSGGGGTSSDAEADASAHHHGQDEGRDTLTAGEAQRAMSDDQVQRLPAMSQNNATEVEKVSGIVAQTRQDVGTRSRDEVLRVLRQRLEQSGIDLPDADVEELVGQITVGE